ncbi:copia protein [Tanacetum coccineum]
MVAKSMDDATRQAFEEEKQKIASIKRASQATSINKLNTGRPSVSTANTPYVSAASTPTGANAGESSFVYLGGQIPIDASTLPNADLPTDPNMPDLEDDYDVFPNEGIFNGAYDDKDKGDPKSAVQTRGKIQNASSAQQALVWIFVDFPYGKKAIGTKWVFRNKRDERGIVVKNKARLVAQGFRQEEGIDYDEIFAPIARIKAIILFLAFASFMRFPLYQMDVKSTFLYGTIREEVKQQPDGIFINQDKYVADILKKFNFWSIRTDTTPIESNNPLVKDEDGIDVDVHVYISMIGSLMYLTASRPDIMDLPFELEAFSDSDYRGASLDRKSTTGGCQFLGRRLISWQCKKQAIVASTMDTESDDGLWL